MMTRALANSGLAPISAPAARLLAWRSASVIAAKDSRSCRRMAAFVFVSGMVEPLQRPVAPACRLPAMGKDPERFAPLRTRNRRHTGTFPFVAARTYTLFLDARCHVVSITPRNVARSFSRNDRHRQEAS